MIFDRENSQRGSAFILALMVVAAVGLLVVPVIYLATTGLRSTNLAQQRYLVKYAADAGVAEAIWHVRYDPAYTPVAGATVRYTPTYNNQQTTLDIEPVDLPTPMPTPTTTTPIESGSPLSISKIVESNYAFACFLGTGCPTAEFNYTIFLENYGTSNERLHDIGDCLPPGFAFVEVTAVNYIHRTGGGKPLLTVAELDSFYYDDDDDDDELCPAGSEMAVWVLEDDDPYILPGETAEIRFTVTAQVGEPDTHSSSADGTTVGVRAAANQDTDEFYILSWQVE